VKVTFFLSLLELICIYQVRRSKHFLRVNLLKNRYLIGHIQTNNELKKNSQLSKPKERNPYAALPQMRLLTYQMPDELLAVASGGEFDEFDLNSFFEATGEGKSAKFKHKNDVQKVVRYYSRRLFATICRDVKDW
jgi:hypothetical protein